MKILSTKVHGVLDYLMSIVLIVSPWLFNFANGGPEMWIPIILGAAALIYSMMTNYELGLVKTLSMKTHLTIDAMSGVLLVASPWIFSFADTVYLPHLILGIIELVAVMMTKTQPSTDYRHSNAHSHTL